MRIVADFCRHPLCGHRGQNGGTASAGARSTSNMMVTFDSLFAGDDNTEMESWLRQVEREQFMPLGTLHEGAELLVLAEDGVDNTQDSSEDDADADSDAVLNDASNAAGVAATGTAMLALGSHSSLSKSKH